MIIFAIIFGIFISSLVEYLLHRIYLHRPVHDHLAKHHKKFLGDSFTREVSFGDVASSFGYILSNILIYSVIIALIFFLKKNIIRMIIKMKREVIFLKLRPKLKIDICCQF